MYPIKRIVLSVLVAAVLAFAWAACDAPDDNGGIGTSPSDPMAPEPPPWAQNVGLCTCFQVMRSPDERSACVMLWRGADEGLNGGSFAGRCEQVGCCAEIQ